MSYKNLEIWQESRKLVVDIHKMTLEKLPKFEMYEEGSQFENPANRLNQQLWKVMAVENTSLIICDL